MVYQNIMKDTKVINMTTHILSKDELVSKCLKLAKERKGGYVCVSNVHMCMEVFDKKEFAEIVNNADFVIPDGRPIAWGQRLLGNTDAKQIRGEDITQAFCEKSNESSLRLGFYGGSSDELLEQVKAKLKRSFPNINIVYAFSPPFRPLTEDERLSVVKDINDAEVDVLFVGIGCPKQEMWMAQNKNDLGCVMLGVGAVFDFISGQKKHAPKWVQKIGMEWFFRLCSEPKRLWKRYYVHNPRFVYFFLQQWLLGKKF